MPSVTKGPPQRVDRESDCGQCCHLCFLRNYNKLWKNESYRLLGVSHTLGRSLYHTIYIRDLIL